MLAAGASLRSAFAEASEEVTGSLSVPSVCAAELSLSVAAPALIARAAVMAPAAPTALTAPREG